MARARGTAAGPGAGYGSGQRSSLVLAVCAGIAVLVAVVFGPTLAQGFLNYDDDVYVRENALVRGGLTLAGAVRALGTVHSFTWHPLTTLAHMLDVELFGLEPRGHHLSSVVLHGATAIALFLTLLGATGALGRSAFVAFVFAVHPQRVESVAWISERKDVLSGLFFVLTLAAYARYARRASSEARFPAGSYATALACFALALAAKPMVVTLPFVLLLLDRWPLRRLGDAERPLGNVRRCVLEKLPFLALAVAAGAAALATQERAMTSGATLSLDARAASALAACGTYLRQLVWPACLALVYPHSRGNVPAGELALALALLVGLTLAAFRWRARFPFLAVGWLWFLGMLLPVIGLVQVGVQAHADRYTYLPHVGLYLALAWGATAAWPAALGRRGLVVAGALAVALLAVQARRQVGRWEDSETVWRHALLCTERNYVAHSQLGNALEARGEKREAAEHYRAALAIQPDHATALYNLGNLLAASGDLEGAIDHYRRAVAARPDYGRAHNNLGSALASAGRYDEALPAFARTVELDPGHVRARLNLATVYLALGRGAEGEAALRELLRIDPRNPEARALLERMKGPGAPR